MTAIQSFRAFLYSQKLGDQAAKLWSPPYDVIHPETQQALKSLHPLNSVRLSLVDSAEDPDRYRKMSKLYQEWRSSEVLTQQKSPAYYLIKDEFEMNGKAAIRRGFVGLIKLQNFGEGQVFPHEYTLAGPKKDRLALLEEMGAEASQIFFCYQDPAMTLERIFSEIEQTKPYATGLDYSNVKRTLWILSDPQQIRLLEQGLSNLDFLIADGHHRYETALEYQRRHNDETSRYVQAYFTNSLSPGFSILPIHRLFHLPTGLTLEAVLERLRASAYETEELDSSQLEILCEHSDASIAFGLVDQSGKRRWRVHRKKQKPTETTIAAVQSDFFEAICRWTPEEMKKGLITYENTDAKFLEVLSGDAQKVGVYLPACTYDEIMAVVKSGERMPQKSSFFAPKLATGLIFYDLRSR